MPLWWTNLIAPLAVIQTGHSGRVPRDCVSPDRPHVTVPT